MPGASLIDEPPALEVEEVELEHGTVVARMSGGKCKPESPMALQACIRQVFYCASIGSDYARFGSTVEFSGAEWAEKTCSRVY